MYIHTINPSFVYRTISWERGTAWRIAPQPRNSESKYYLSKFRVHSHTLHFFPRYLSNCPVLLLYDERYFSTTQACHIRTIRVVVLISDHFITFIKSSRLWSTAMTFAMGLFAGWCWCWFGLVGAGFLWEKNTVGWLVWAGWNQQANRLS